MAKTSLVPVERIERSILLVRGEKVMLDADLAALYEVETRVLVRNVKRQLGRFPEDFMIQLSAEEWRALRSQIGISKPEGRGGRRYLPYAFTEQGVAMLSSVLNSERAVQVNIEIVRAFVRLRRLLATNTDLARKVTQLEAASRRHDVHFRAVFEVIRRLMAPGTKPARRVGFTAGIRANPSAPKAE